MNRQLQIELWPECRCARCKFCNLVLASELRGSGQQSNPNILLTPAEKCIYIDRAISFLYDAEWSKYDTLLLRGGEVFNDYDNAIVESWDRFIRGIADFVAKGTIKKVFLVTSLKYKYDSSLLKLTLELFSKYNVDPREKVLIGTSWDKEYRFTGNSHMHWENCMATLDSLGIPVHITSILTQAFIEGFFAKDEDVLSVMSRDFDFIAAQGKPELLFLEKFFPVRKDCTKFLTLLKDSPEYHPIWYRLLHQNYRRAESIYFTEQEVLGVRDLENYQTVLGCDSKDVLKCGHPAEYANYVDSDVCFLCDLAVLSKMK